MLVMGVMAGCGKKMTAETPVQDMKAPKWVKHGGGVFNDKAGKVLHGVGSVSGIKSQHLRRATADDRARADIGKVMEVYSSSLLKDYASSTLADDPNLSTEEAHVEQAIKTVTSVTLSGVQIIEHWENPVTAEYYSLARVNLKEFKNNLNSSKKLDKRVKDYIKQNADKVHEELSKETQ